MQCSPWALTFIPHRVGALVLNRDRFLHIPLIADWLAIIKKGHKNARKETKVVQVGERTSSLYKVSQTNVNGTLIIELKPNASERICTHGIIPYKEPT